MFHIIKQLGHNLQIIVEHGGYLLLFLTTAAEGIPILGQFVPGNTIILISGFLSKLHILNFTVVCIVVILGAMLGDIIGYTLGRKYGIKILTRFSSYFFIEKVYIEKVQRLIRENIVKTTLIGRFSPITRPLTPFIVGASGINTKKFWLLDFLSIVVWSLFSVGIGYIFGSSYGAVSKVIGEYILIFILISVVIIWAYRFVNKQFHIFVKYDLIILGINLLGLYLFFKTIQDALTDKVFLLRLDLYINDFFLVHGTEPYISILNFITNLFSPVVMMFASSFAVVYFLYKKDTIRTLITIFTMGGGGLAVYAIKNVVLRLRPEDAFIPEVGFSFPSGHAFAATVLATLAVYFFVIKVRSMVLRELLIALSLVAVILVTFTRVYLGVHWLSDVLAGIGFGLFWTTSVILLVKYISSIVKMLKVKKAV